jgi:hypothetical protein
MGQIHWSESHGTYSLVNKQKFNTQVHIILRQFGGLQLIGANNQSNTLQ